ncbi:MAG: thioesterase [Christensenellaceae bacterium]
MQTKFEQKMTLRATDVDVNANWRPSAILLNLQEIAEDHAVVMGCGREYLGKKNIAWVLTRLHLKMIHYPKLYETIKLCTWPAKPTKMFFVRHSMFFDDQNNELGASTSLWVLFDLKERFLCRSSALGKDYPYDLSHGIALKEPRKIKMPEDMPLAQKRTVSYSDMDMNGHMNNAKYADWVCELFDSNTLQTKTIADLKINYIAEAYMGQSIDLYKKMQDDIFYICGKIGDKVIFDSTVKWC